jgi:hypothetical protein
MENPNVMDEGNITLHIVKEECRHILKPNNEASLKSVQSSIQPDGQFIHPVIRLFTATLNSSIYSNPKSVPSSRRTVFFLGGFVFVGAAAVAQTQHTEQPLIHPVILPDCFFWVGLFLWQQQW